jgi:hypothetical protein
MQDDLREGLQGNRGLLPPDEWASFKVSLQSIPDLLFVQDLAGNNACYHQM